MKTLNTTQNISINPLIDERGDTTPVSAVLQFLSSAFARADADGLSLHFSECYGLSLILQACSGALDTMNRPDYREGGAE